jgi:predicted Zn-dependent protease
LYSEELQHGRKIDQLKIKKLISMIFIPVLLPQMKTTYAKWFRSGLVTALLCSLIWNPGSSTAQSKSDPELNTAAALIHQGRLAEAVPHLEHAHGYAASFNLALCYLGLGEYNKAAIGLEALRASGHDNASVNNLLAQAYVGQAQPQKALEAFHRAMTLAPNNEKLYAFIADACTDHKNFDLGLQVVNEGLKNLPRSARLHYERAMFLAQTGNDVDSQAEFTQAAKLAPGTDIAYLALTQKNLFAGNIPEAIRVAREGIRAGHDNPVLLDLLGEVLVHAGATPGQPEFAEAQTLLEHAVAQKPDYSTAQIALGRLYLMEDRPTDAVTHLEIGRRLEPENRAVYTSLADAYRKSGQKDQAREMMEILGKLMANQR